MVEQRANLDYGRDDNLADEIAEVAKLPDDDYLSIERADNAVEADEHATLNEADEASTFGAP